VTPALIQRVRPRGLLSHFARSLPTARTGRVALAIHSALAGRVNFGVFSCVPHSWSVRHSDGASCASLFGGAV